MSEKKIVQDSGEEVIARAKDFWAKYSKLILGAGGAFILLVGGYLAYVNFVKEPNEEKATEAMFKAEEYFRKDSINQALNGDGQYMGFLKIISKYGSSDAANLASFYAGSCYLKLDDNANAIKYLKKFSSDAKQIQQRAYKLLGDASADAGKNSDALDYYKKAAHHFEKDEANSSEALFMAAYFADRVMKNQKEAIALFKELKEKYPKSQHGFEADNYLAQLGVYNVN
ncbi:MAG: tetratricopeptide repeat protein [Chitinophagaceae bacterium]